MIVVLMCRFGDLTDYYLLGLYTDVEKAKEEGRKERAFRGSKYLPAIVPIKENERFIINDAKLRLYL